MSFDALKQELFRIVGQDGVIVAHDQKLVYSYDASFDTHMPDIVVLPQSTAEVSAVMTVAARHGVPLVARGAGTGLSGGALPLKGGILMALTRMRTIHAIDPRNRRAVVDAGVVNQHLVDAVGKHGLTYAPDPGSGRTSTIGGNIASNAGGPHCLAYGVTVNHVTGVKAVLADGTVVETGSPLADGVGYDLTGVLVGSEGTLAVVTEATLQLMGKAESVRTTMVVFQSIEDASAAVSAVIAAGIVPAAMEMMDGKVCRAVEAAVHAGYPDDAGGVLLIEVEGLEDGLAATMATIEAICREHGAREVRHAASADERAKLWLGRKSALGAMGRIAPSYFLEDGVVPRHRLPEVMAFVEEVGRKYDLPIGNFFHAGDGNIHPTILFDRRDAAVLDRARKAAHEILEKCIDVGGTVSGEHGIGTEKQDYLSRLYTRDDLDAMADLKRSFDPAGRLNPGKIFPRCYHQETPRPHVSASPTTGGGFTPHVNGQVNGHANGPSSVTRVAARLEEIVGRAHVFAGDDAPDYAVNGRAPKLVVSPGSVEETAAVLAVAHELRLGVAPMGGNTMRLLGNPLTRFDVALSTARLDRIVDHYPSDLTLAVQAGRSLATTNHFLAATGQQLPLDAALAGRATLGGIMAAGPVATGLRRLAYGTMRDMVTGIQVIRPDGRVFRRGGMVVKNVAGYDMSRLQYGALGTLGIITELNLKLLPMPQTSTAVLAAFPRIQDADAVVTRLMASRLQPAAVVCLDDALAGALALPHGPGGQWLLVRFDGRSEAVARQVRELRTWMDAAGAQVAQTWDEAMLATVWPKLADFSRMDAIDANAALLRVNVRAGETAGAWQRVEDDCRRHDLHVMRLADAANGIVWLRVDAPQPDALTRLAAQVAAWAALWPQTTVAALPPSDKETLSALGVRLWGRTPQAVTVMQAINDLFDPNHVLNPGRFLIGGTQTAAVAAVRDVVAGSQVAG